MWLHKIFSHKPKSWRTVGLTDGVWQYRLLRPGQATPAAVWLAHVQQHVLRRLLADSALDRPAVSTVRVHPATVPAGVAASSQFYFLLLLRSAARGR